MIGRRRTRRTQARLNRKADSEPVEAGWLEPLQTLAVKLTLLSPRSTRPQTDHGAK